LVLFSIFEPTTTLNIQIGVRRIQYANAFFVTSYQYLGTVGLLAENSQKVAYNTENNE
jgi:hypothetical protein